MNLYELERGWEGLWILAIDARPPVVPATQPKPESRNG